MKLNIYFKEAFACSLTFSFSLSFSLSFYICPFCCWPGIEVGLIRKASRFYLRSVKPRKEKKLESERIVLSTFIIRKGKEKYFTISTNFVLLYMLLNDHKRKLTYINSLRYYVSILYVDAINYSSKILLFEFKKKFLFNLVYFKTIQTKKQTNEKKRFLKLYTPHVFICSQLTTPKNSIFEVLSFSCGW